MPATKLLVRVILLCIVLQGSSVGTFCQDISWMKGIWKGHSGTPFLVPPVQCINTLQITTADDSTFNGIQTTYFAKDTNIRKMYACNGLLTQSKKQFYRGDVVYKKDSNHRGYEWNDCAGYKAGFCSLYVEEEKIILLVTTNTGDSACNSTVAYYRDLSSFNNITQQQLISLYGKLRYSSLITSSSYKLINTHKKNVATLDQQDTLQTDVSLNINALPTVLHERKNKLAQTLQITSPYIEVILLDDAEIDGDIVSLYHNNVEVLSHKTLGKEVIKYSFKADKQHTYHELVLVAENLGSIPPNTALMRIRAGNKKYELTTRANLQENAKVIIEYTGE
ncbi:hypothetical protein FC093_03360 [Ilyomonas limi]|uniref:Uncharacterized protein n=1 Tax=Ilyomonas limi TaxID=2575867 RepID=A0A4U3L8H1_9BACT|nr:hypothetical protein [Ilyomonas limi]TKK70744.1 hypothetical protein FC093_03360 [Ilyomonas limi]